MMPKVLFHEKSAFCFKKLKILVLINFVVFCATAKLATHWLHTYLQPEPLLRPCKKLDFVIPLFTFVFACEKWFCVGCFHVCENPIRKMHMFYTFHQTIVIPCSNWCFSMKIHQNALSQWNHENFDFDTKSLFWRWDSLFGVKMQFYAKCGFDPLQIINIPNGILMVGAGGPQMVPKSTFCTKITFGLGILKFPHFHAFIIFYDISLLSGRPRENIVFLVVYWWFWDPKSQNHTFGVQKPDLEPKSWKWFNFMDFLQKVDFELFEHFLRKCQIP